MNDDEASAVAVEDDEGTQEQLRLYSSGRQILELHLHVVPLHCQLANQRRHTWEEGTEGSLPSRVGCARGSFGRADGWRP